MAEAPVCSSTGAGWPLPQLKGAAGGMNIGGGRAFLVLAAAAALALGGCGVPRPASSHHRTPEPSPPPEKGALSVAQAFLQDMVEGSLDRQWPLLAPAERSTWPSEAARSAMLAAKFSGAARVVAFALGRPVAGAEWASPEDPRVQVANATEIPVVLAFANSSALSPPGVATLYQHTQLVLEGPSSSPASSTYLVLGEGPAAMEAPVITPAKVAPTMASVPILMYHLVGPFPDRSLYSSQYSYDLDYGLTVPPDQFSSEMQYLVANGYQAISLYRLADFLLYGLPLPAHPVAITFDDGFANEYQYALPVLEADGLTATFFPCSGLIGVRNGEEEYMPASELGSLAQMGYAVQDHTYNDGTVLWGQDLATIQELTGDSARVLESITGQPVQFIAYSGLWPYASPEQARPAQEQLFTQLGSLGYVGGLEDNWVGRFAWQESSAALWEWPRVRAYPGESLKSFATLLTYG
ncbi:MAG: polysaccharide deacetylase family protein [Candidatus Dormibacteria bacterium]